MQQMTVQANELEHNIKDTTLIRQNILYGRKRQKADAEKKEDTTANTNQTDG